MRGMIILNITRRMLQVIRNTVMGGVFDGSDALPGAQQSGGHATGD